MGNEMKSILTLLSIFCFVCSSCNRHSDSFAGVRSKTDKLKALWGGDGDAMLASQGFLGPEETDFLALEEADLQGVLADGAIPLPFHEPGAPGSGIPSLDQFREAMAGLAHIFQSVYFSTDDYVLRKAEFVAVIDRMAEYLKQHTNTHISVAGHCDERGSEAYNLALGTRRSNYIRSLLVKRGVDPNHIHPISYGKERPADQGHTPTAWSHNRRVEFKIHESQ
jgi:peptidoglycan-associated lipoprotein